MSAVVRGLFKAPTGVYKGRKPSVPVDEIKRLAALGVGATAVAKQLGVGRASVYRALDEAA